MGIECNITELKLTLFVFNIYISRFSLKTMNYSFLTLKVVPFVCTQHNNKNFDNMRS